MARNSSFRHWVVIQSENFRGLGMPPWFRPVSSNSFKICWDYEAESIKRQRINNLVDFSGCQLASPNTQNSSNGFKNPPTNIRQMPCPPFPAKQNGALLRFFVWQLGHNFDPQSPQSTFLSPLMMMMIIPWVVSE